MIPANSSGTAKMAVSKVKAILAGRLMIAIATVAIASIITASVVLPPSVVLSAGQPAKRDIEAPKTIINRPATDRLREEARKAYRKNAQSFPENYEINLSYSYTAEEMADSTFSAIIAAKNDHPHSEPEAISKDVEKTLSQSRGLNISAADLALLAAMDDDELGAVRKAVVDLVGNTMRTMRVDESNIQSIAGGVPEDLERLGVPQRLVKPAARVAAAALQPNLSLDLAKVEKAAEEHAATVQPIYINKGQSIIRRGDIATDEQIEILSDLGLLGARGNVYGWIGIAMLAALAVSYSAMYIRNLAPLSEPSPLALAAVAGLGAILAGAVLVSVAPHLAPYLIPAAFATMLISSLDSLEMALAVNLSIAVMVGVLTRGDFFASIAAMAAGAAGAYSVPGLRDRSGMTRAVITVGVAVAGVSIVYGLALGEPEIVSRWYLGFVNGIISTVMTLGSLPFFESIFGVTSPLRLLELSNPGHPLLKRILLEAPGTYHHSILVGNLGETAAQAIGADAALVRVGALYHDCGKLKRPYFFAENQFSQGNPHDKISPSLSTLIITSHAKDGVELAREYKLPIPVIDIIQQHHGTGLVSFFYARASECGRDMCVEEKDFRYPGPKPQTKEAAIVMLADSTEAAVRAQQSPSSWQVNNTVRKIIKDKLNDGQLDECSLTLRDLHMIEKAFMSVLSGIYHERVEYPDLPQKDAKGLQKQAVPDPEVSAENGVEQGNSVADVIGGGTTLDAR